MLRGTTIVGFWWLVWIGSARFFLLQHWHGFNQYGTSWSDGASGVTQCPISPGNSFLYQFQADNAGTFWYHSHFGNFRALFFGGDQITSALRGSILWWSQRTHRGLWSQRSPQIPVWWYVAISFFSFLSLMQVDQQSITVRWIVVHHIISANVGNRKYHNYPWRMVRMM